MKNIIIALVVLLPLSTFANTPAIRPEGKYVFSKIKTVLTREVEMVPRGNVERMRELARDSYSCTLRGDFFSCQKALKGIVSSEIERDVMLTWSGRFFEFKKSNNLPAITSEGENLVEMDVYDSVTFEDESVSEFHYYLLRNSIEVHKIVLNFPSETRWMIINNESNVSMLVQRTVQLSNLKSRTFDIEVFFNRE